MTSDRRTQETLVNTNKLVLHQHPFAAFCWKPLIALYELELPFESHIIEGEASRCELAAIWPMASIPVLRDETADLTLPESSMIIEYLNELISPAGALIPRDRERSLEARLWERIIDGYVATPMQRIVGDSLRPGSDRDPTSVDQAHATLDRAYQVLDDRLAGLNWAAGEALTVAECAAGPALFYGRVVHPWDEARRENLTRYYRSLMHRASIRRVIDEARPYRDLFPLPWPADVDAHQAAD
ncbi:MAG: glutathione S-transferase family protein [Actinomycetota bacterium]|nr:glutathione S-transferase family protein [Actinomycetota bacterium]